MLSNLVPSGLPTRLRHGGEDAGEIEFSTNFYWLLENNNSWYRRNLVPRVLSPLTATPPPPAPPDHVAPRIWVLTKQYYMGTGFICPTPINHDLRIYNFFAANVGNVAVSGDKTLGTRLVPPYRMLSFNSEGKHT